jgi:hypothetical protein
MDALNFAYWLQGFFEISGNTKLNETQVQVIKDHLKLVFEKQTPNRGLDSQKFCNPNPFITITPANPFPDLSKGPTCSAETSNKVGLTLNDNVAPLTFDEGVSPLTLDGNVSPLTFEGKNYTISSNGAK